MKRHSPHRRRSQHSSKLRRRRLSLERLEDRRVLSVFTVDTTDDTPDASLGDGIAQDASGKTSLRAAIEEANFAAEADTINFNIPGAGVHTIQPLSALPAITDPVVIDGYSQPRASPNTLAVGDNAVLLIELDGTQAGWASGLSVAAGGSTIQGLVINRFAGYGIDVYGNGGNAIAGNFIGTDATGLVGLGNGSHGVAIRQGAQGNRIGIDGAEANALGDRNLIAGNGGIGVYIGDAGTEGNVVAGNYIGTTATGFAALGGAGGVQIGWGASHNLIGTNDDGQGDALERNVISGNAGAGIFIFGDSNTPAATGNVVAGNYIGTTADGASALGNASDPNSSYYGGVAIMGKSEGNFIGTNSLG